MAEYKISGNGVQHISGKCIPENIENRDWRDYLRWLSRGNVPDPEHTAEELSTIEAENARLSAIRSEIAGSPLKRVTVAQAFNYIDNQIDNAVTVVQIKDAIKNILKKMVVHIID